MGSVTLNGFEMAGTTTDRPDNVEAGQPYFDTTLGTWLVYNASNWLTVVTNTADATGNTENVSIVSGDSSAGASGNVTIDVGTAGTTVGTIDIGGANVEAINIAPSGVLLGLYGADAIAQHATDGDVTGFAAGSGTASKSDSTWDGAAGSTSYTVGDIVTALKGVGIMAA